MANLDRRFPLCDGKISSQDLRAAKAALLSKVFDRGNTMRLERTFALAGLLVGAIVALPAAAECVYPKTPGAAPDGSKASEQEMVAAIDAVKTYNKEVDEYLACLEDDAKKSLAAAGSDAERAKQIQAMTTKKHDAAVEELHARADDINVQIRAYKSKHKS
jgi:hypothetical protein